MDLVTLYDGAAFLNHQDLPGLEEIFLKIQNLQISPNLFGVFELRNIYCWDNTGTNIFDEDTNLKICLLPEHESPKVEKR